MTEETKTKLSAFVDKYIVDVASDASVSNQPFMQLIDALLANPKDGIDETTWERKEEPKELDRPVVIRVVCQQGSTQISETTEGHQSSPMIRKTKGKDLKNTVLAAFRSTKQLLHPVKRYQLNSQEPKDKSFIYHWEETALARLNDKRHFKITLDEDTTQYSATLRVVNQTTN